MINVAILPGVSGYVYSMPDAHEGYGFPVGGVAVMRLTDGVVSPGGVGYDINCGVRLLVSRLLVSEFRSQLESLVHDFVWANRQAITHAVRSTFTRILGTDGELRLLYDVAHNIAKLEEYDGELVCVAPERGYLGLWPKRGGNTGDLPKGRATGLCSGSMGTANFVMAGTDASAALSFGQLLPWRRTRDEPGGGKARRERWGAPA